MSDWMVLSQEHHDLADELPAICVSFANLRPPSHTRDHATFQATPQFLAFSDDDHAYTHPLSCSPTG